MGPISNVLTCRGMRPCLQRGVSMGNFSRQYQRPASPSRSVILPASTRKKRHHRQSGSCRRSNELGITITDPGPYASVASRYQTGLTRAKVAFCRTLPTASDLTMGVVETTLRCVAWPFGFADYNLNGDPHGVRTLSGFIFDKVTRASDYGYLAA